MLPSNIPWQVVCVLQIFAWIDRYLDQVVVALNVVRASDEPMPSHLHRLRHSFPFSFVR